MKTIIAICIFAIAGCSLDIDVDVLSMTEAIYREIEYVQTPLVVQHPEVTERTGTGDCADMAALLMWRMVEARAYGAEMVCYQIGGGRHATVEYEGVSYECTTGGINDPESMESWDEIARYSWHRLNRYWKYCSDYKEAR